MKNFLLICFLFTSGFSFGQAGAFHLGIGHYSYTSHDQFAINFGFERELNKVFSLGLNGSFLDESKQTSLIFLPNFPETNFIETTTTFGGFTAMADLDAFIVGMDKNKFQLHVGIGVGILAISNDDAYGMVRGYAEERVKINPNLSAGIGYSYGINLYDEEALQQFYFNVKRHF